MFTKLYKTEISCSKYNFRIDETITVTGRLIDFNNQAVIGEEVTLQVDEGLFENNEKTYTGITNSEGEIKVIYTPSDWGVYTLRCNDVNVLINIRGGWKEFTPKSILSNMKFWGKYNQDEVIVYFEGNVPTYSFNNNSPVTVLQIEEEDIFLRPYSTVCVPSENCRGEVYVTSGGDVKCIMKSLASHSQYIHYSRKK